MLETDDIDDDYFTPVPSTSLANIFGSNSQSEANTENPSLKYTPPPPKHAKSEESKVTECIFACALLGYEWSNNEYNPKGKVGFAILKIVTSGLYNIVLYDSNKTTLSCTSVSSSLEIIIRENTYISYYDNSQNHWSLCATHNEISKISDILSNLNVVIKYSTNKDKKSPDPQKFENASTKSPINEYDKNDNESDTDSSINRKTKASILSRMASMGQSILPPNTFSQDITSDSSDANDMSNAPLTVRHKAIKSVIKRINPEKPTMLEPSQIVNHPVSVISKSENIENVSLYSPLNNHLFQAGTNTSYGNDFNLLLTEQRINNSELRININRMSDKVDQILDRVKDVTILEKNTGNTNFQIDLAQKLILEYENKIRMYEDIIKSKEINKIGNTSAVETHISKKCEFCQNTIQEFQSNESELMNLREEIQLLKTKMNDSIESTNEKENSTVKKIQALEEVLELKNNEISQLSEKLAANVLENSDEITNKIKNIMNDTYRTVIANFESDKTYTGETIKSVIGTVIKQVTIESLKEL